MSTERKDNNQFEKLKFERLATDGNNYLQWAPDATSMLIAEGLDHTIEIGFNWEILLTPNADGSMPNPNATQKRESKEKRKDAAKAIIILRRHIDSTLMSNFYEMDNPADVWKGLMDCFENLITIHEDRTFNEWTELRFQDYPNITAYNLELFDIVKRIMLCKNGHLVTDQRLIDKTLKTFPMSLNNVAHNLKALKLTQYSKLVEEILKIEADTQDRARNANARPPTVVGANSFAIEAPLDTYEQQTGQQNDQANEFNYNNPHRGAFRGNRGKTTLFRPYGITRGIGRGQIQRGGIQGRGANGNVNRVQYDNTCYKCGLIGHMARDCRSSTYLQTLHQRYGHMIKASIPRNTPNAPSAPPTRNSNNTAHSHYVDPYERNDQEWNNELQIKRHHSMDLTHMPRTTNPMPKVISNQRILQS